MAATNHETIGGTDGLDLRNLLRKHGVPAVLATVARYVRGQEDQAATLGEPHLADHYTDQASAVEVATRYAARYQGRIDEWFKENG